MSTRSNLKRRRMTLDKRADELNWMIDATGCRMFEEMMYQMWDDILQVKEELDEIERNLSTPKGKRYRFE